MAGKQFSSTLIAALLGLTTMILPAVQADEQSGSAQPSRDPVARYVEAGASPEQVKKIRELGKDFDDHSKVRWQLLMNLQKQMREFSTQADADESTVIAKQEEINKVVGEMSTERIKLMLKIRSILTPEQKQKLVDLMQQQQKAQATQGAAH
jgi:Spy/CpxP family protein refolding chaperone